MKNSGIPLSSLNPKLRAQIESLIGSRAGSVEVSERTVAHARGMLRQDRKGLNKTEAAFLEYLKAAYPGREIRVQDVTLRVGNGSRYTPDFVVDPDLGSSEIVAYETKGFMRDDANVKLKAAARMFKWITFYLVRRHGKTGGWDIQRVLP